MELYRLLSNFYCIILYFNASNNLVDYRYILDCDCIGIRISNVNFTFGGRKAKLFGFSNTDTYFGAQNMQILFFHTSKVVGIFHNSAILW